MNCTKNPGLRNTSDLGLPDDDDRRAPRVETAKPGIPNPKPRKVNHGWTRMNTDESDRSALLICVHLCPSVVHSLLLHLLEAQIRSPPLEKKPPNLDPRLGFRASILFRISCFEFRASACRAAEDVKLWKQTATPYPSGRHGAGMVSCAMNHASGIPTSSAEIAGLQSGAASPVPAVVAGHGRVLLSWRH